MIIMTLCFKQQESSLTDKQDIRRGCHGLLVSLSFTTVAAICIPQILYSSDLVDSFLDKIHPNIISIILMICLFSFGFIVGSIFSQASAGGYAVWCKGIQTYLGHDPTLISRVNALDNAITSIISACVLEIQMTIFDFATSSSHSVPSNVILPLSLFGPLIVVVLICMTILRVLHLPDDSDEPNKDEDDKEVEMDLETDFLVGLSRKHNKSFRGIQKSYKTPSGSVFFNDKSDLV